MITSKITSKSQTTVPQSIRMALRLQPGDEIAYEIQADRVVITKLETAATDDPFKTFGEWDGDADRKAYAGL
jgi:antitoxin PrlF